VLNLKLRQLVLQDASPAVALALANVTGAPKDRVKSSKPETASTRAVLATPQTLETKFAREL